MSSLDRPDDCLGRAGTAADQCLSPRDPADNRHTDCCDGDAYVNIHSYLNPLTHADRDRDAHADPHPNTNTNTYDACR
jgi:hypothetical protein